MKRGLLVMPPKPLPLIRRFPPLRGHPGPPSFPSISRWHPCTAERGAELLRQPTGRVGVSGRRSGSRSSAPHPCPTHAHSQASFMRAVSHTPALTLYTHPGARTSLHYTSAYAQIQEHTLSHTHRLSHTQPLFSGPSYTHSHADNPHSRSETPTRFTYTV